MAKWVDQTAQRIANMVVSGILITPVLALVKAVTPLPLPWLAVFIPWLSILLLLLGWFAAKIIVRVLWDLIHLRT